MSGEKEESLSGASGGSTRSQPWFAHCRDGTRSSSSSKTGPPNSSQTSNGPAFFPGELAEGETWNDCPYIHSHTFLRATKHLVKCRNAYEKMKKEKGELMDISICQYNWIHHVPDAQMRDHERRCVDQFIATAYIKNVFKENRASQNRKPEEDDEGDSENN